jgi:glycosyltransferase involved in cell wall biosynthesis
LKAKGVTIVIPAHNEESTIEQVLEAMISQAYSGKVEIIVVDDMSSDRTGEIAKAMGVKVVRNRKNLGLAGSINKGISLSRNNTVCVLHADCRPSSKNWLSQMVKALYSDEDIVCSTSPIVTPKRVWDKYGFWQKIYTLRSFKRETMSSQKKPVFVDEIGGDKCDMFKKSFLEKIGGFDSKTYRVAGEDADVVNKIKIAGYKIIRIPLPVIHMHGARSFGPRYTWKKALQLSEASGVLYRKYGFKHSKYWNELTKSIVYISLLIPFINVISALIIILEIGYFTYQAAVETKSPKVALVPFNKFITDIMNIIGFLRGYFTSKQVT